MSKRAKTSKVLSLIAEYKLIDAQLHYDGTLTEDDDEFDAMVAKAVEKQHKIFKRLSKEKPSDRQEVRLMLLLAVDWMKHSMAERQHVKIIEQATAALGSMDFEKSAEQ
jgi:hypothetical protein